MARALAVYQTKKDLSEKERKEIKAQALEYGKATTEKRKQDTQLIKDKEAVNLKMIEVDEKYRGDKEKIDDRIFKATNSRLENELRDVKKSFAEDRQTLQDKLKYDTRITEKEKSELKNKIAVLNKAEQDALSKVRKEESDRNAKTARQNLNDIKQRVKDALNGEIQILENKINNVEKAENISKQIKLKKITEYLQQEANVYRKYGKRSELSGTDSKELMTKASDVEVDIANRKRKYNKEVIQEEIDLNNKSYEISIQNIENLGIINKEAEDKILNDKIFSTKLYITKLVKSLDEDRKNHKLTADQKLAIETNLAKSITFINESTQSRIDKKREEVLSKREHDFTLEASFIQLLSDLEIDNKFKTNQKLIELNKKEIASEKEKFDYIKKNNPNDPKAIREQEAKLIQVRNEGLILQRKNKQDTIEFFKNVDDAYYNYTINDIDNRRKLEEISSFEARRLTREANNERIKDLEDRLEIEKDVLKKAGLDQEITNLKTANLVSLKEDSKEVLTNFRNINLAIGSMGDALSMARDAGVRAFGQITSTISKLGNAIQGILESKDVVGVIISALNVAVTLISTLINFQNVQEDNLNKLKDAELEYQKLTLEGQLQTTEKKLQILEHEHNTKIAQLDREYKLTRKTVYDAMLLHDEKRKLETQFINDKKKIEDEAIKTTLDLYSRYYKSIRDLEEQTLEVKLEALEQEKQEEIKKAQEEYKNEVDLMLALTSLDNEYAKKKKDLEEEEKKRKEQADKEEIQRTKDLVDYQIKLMRLFNKEQDASEMEQLEEKKLKEEHYIDENFKNEKINLRLKAELNKQFELAKTQLIKESEAKRLSIIKDSHDKILEWSKSEKESIISKYEQEANKIDSNLSALRSKYQTEINRIEEIEKLLGKEGLDIETQQNIAIKYKSDLAKTIADTQGSRFRFTDEEFAKLKTRQDLDLSNKVLEGITPEARFAEEKKIALERIAYLDEYKSHFNKNSKEYLDFELEIKTEKERYFQAEKERLERNAERNKLEGEAYLRKEEKTRLSEKIKEEIKNADKIAQEQAKSLNNIDQQTKIITTNFDNGLQNAAQNFINKVGGGINQSVKDLNDSLNKSQTEISQVNRNIQPSGATIPNIATTGISSTGLKSAVGQKPSFTIGGSGKGYEGSLGSILFQVTQDAIDAGMASASGGKDDILQKIAQASGISFSSIKSAYGNDSMEQLKARARALGVKGYRFGGISSGSDSGYPIEAHGRELHLNQNQGDSLAYLFKLALLPKPDIPKMAMAGSTSSINNINVNNNFSGMNINNGMDLDKVTKYIDTSINNSIRRIK